MANNDDEQRLLGPSTDDISRYGSGVHADGNAPSLTRRMSSQFLVQVERQRSVADTLGITNTVNQFVPDSIATRFPGLVRNESQLKLTYFCNICFTKYPVEEGFTLRRCQHQFCTECMKGFMTNKIDNGVIHLKCFFPVYDEKACGEEIDEEDIHQIVEEVTWDKYKRFKANLENNLSRQCPYCNETQIGDPKSPIITCENQTCGKQFCLYHSSAHSFDQTCEQYELSIAKETKMNEMAIAELGDNVRPCPKCNFRIIKSGGCNHMKCVKCSCSFCWLCMQQIEDEELPFHYKDPNSPCKGQQFTGMERAPLPKWLVCWAVFWTVIFCLPSTALGIVCGIIICPLVICCDCKTDTGESYGLFSAIFGCSLFWLFMLILIPSCIILIILSVLRSIYDVIRICLPCLPPCPQRERQDQRPEQLL